MDGDTSWDTCPGNMQPDFLRKCQEFGLRAYLYYRERHNRGIARELTAKALALTPRKTRAILELEPAAIRREEYRRARTAYIDHLIQKERDLIRRTEATRRERFELQSEEDSECGPFSLPLFRTVGMQQSSAAHRSAPSIGGGGGRLAQPLGC